MRVTASVASVNPSQLADVVSQLDQAGVDAYHLDSIESREIFAFATHLRSLTLKPFDLHLITQNPEEFWEDIRLSGISEVHLQLENLHKPLFIPEDLQGKIGLAVLASTPPKLFSVYRKQAASILLMLTTPGKSGGKFTPAHFANIIRYREMYPEIPMTVDGGVNHEVASVLSLMGIRTIVSGSFLFSRDSIQEAVDLLHHHQSCNWSILDVMAKGTEIFTSSTRSFGVFARSWWINAEGKVEEITENLQWIENLEKISNFQEVGGEALFVDQSLSINLLRQTLPQLNPVPRYVFAVDANRSITGSFFIQLSNYDNTPA